MRAAIVIALLCVACAPRLDRRTVGGSAEEVEIRRVPVRGFRARTVLDDGRTVTGELLAVGDRHLFLLLPGPTRIVAVTRFAVREVGISRPEDVGPSSAFEVLARPAPDTDGTGMIDALFQFARFPQGPPRRLLEIARIFTDDDADAVRLRTLRASDRRPTW